MAHYPIPPAHEIAPVEQVPLGGRLRAADEVPRKWSRAELDALIGAAVALAIAENDRTAAAAVMRAGVCGGAAPGMRR